jgi:pseudouridylate synthase / pseudouridine kinase
VAVCYSSLGNQRATSPAKQPAEISIPTENEKVKVKDVKLTSPKLVVVGSSAVDIICQPDPKSERSLDSGSTTPGLVTLTFGGVARNIAESALRVLSTQNKDEHTTMLISPIASDHFAELIIANMKSIGLRTDGLISNNAHKSRSATCVMLLDRHGELLHGVADMCITSDLQHQQVSFIFLACAQFLTDNLYH